MALRAPCLSLAVVALALGVTGCGGDDKTETVVKTVEGKGPPKHPVAGRWVGRITQYGPGDDRTRSQFTMVLREPKVGGNGGRTQNKGRTQTGDPFNCGSDLQVEQVTDRAVVYREDTTRGGCTGTARTRVERQGEQLTLRSTAESKDGRSTQLGRLSKR